MGRGTVWWVPGQTQLVVLGQINSREAPDAGGGARGTARHRPSKSGCDTFGSMMSK